MTANVHYQSFKIKIFGKNSMRPVNRPGCLGRVRLGAETEAVKNKIERQIDI